MSVPIRIIALRYPLRKAEYSERFARFRIGMNEGCAPMGPLLDGLADGEIEPSRVEPHLSSCASCRAELEAIRALKARLEKVRLPDVPRRRRHRARWAAAAAAGIAVILFFLGAPPPSLLALSAKMHDDVLSGRLVLSDLGIAPKATPADYAGRCPCPPDLGDASPFVVYRLGGARISVLALTETLPGPDLARRVGADTVLSERCGGLRLIWISRLDEQALRGAAARLRPAAGVSLRDFTCGACCALLASRGREADGPVTLELLSGPLDPARVTELRPRLLAK
jgi:hypothetical protein